MDYPTSITYARLGYDQQQFTLANSSGNISGIIDGGPAYSFLYGFFIVCLHDSVERKELVVERIPRPNRGSVDYNGSHVRQAYKKHWLIDPINRIKAIFHCTNIGYSIIYWSTSTKSMWLS